MTKILKFSSAPFFCRQEVETNSALVCIFVGDYICWTLFFSAPVGEVNVLSFLVYLHCGR